MKTSPKYDPWKAYKRQRALEALLRKAVALQEAELQRRAALKISLKASRTRLRKDARLQRREAIGNLLRDTDLSLAAIAERIGSTLSAVQQMQIKYFPALRRPRKPRTVTGSAFERREAVGALLQETPKLTLQAIADKTGISRERVRQIQVKYFPAFPRQRRAKKAMEGQ